MISRETKDVPTIMQTWFRATLLALGLARNDRVVIPHHFLLIALGSMISTIIWFEEDLWDLG